MNEEAQTRALDGMSEEDAQMRALHGMSEEEAQTRALDGKSEEDVQTRALRMERKKRSGLLAEPKERGAEGMARSAEPREPGDADAEVQAAETSVAGIPAVRLENEWLRVVVLVGKGADVWELVYKPLGIDLLMKTKSGLEPLRGRDLRRDRLLHYADPYPGGWQDILPNRARFGDRAIGADREGESAGMPWAYAVSRKEGEVVLSCWAALPETPLAVTKSFRLSAGEPELRIEEEAANAGSEPVRFIWTHHPAFGAPLVDAAARIRLPEDCRAFRSDRYERNRDEPPSTFEEEIGSVTLADGSCKDLREAEAPVADGGSCYVPLIGASEGEAGIDNALLGLSMRLRWDLETFPCLRYWSRNDKEMYTVALEPSASRFSDIDDGIRHGECLSLNSGEKRATWLTLRADPLQS